MENETEIKDKVFMTAKASMDSWDDFLGFITDQCERNLANSKQTYGIKLASEEILSNIIRENEASKSSENKVNIWISSGTIETDIGKYFEIRIEDNAPFFDPNLGEKREIESEIPIEERQIGGLGLFLVQNSCDEASYEWKNDRNCYHLRMRLK